MKLAGSSFMPTGRLLYPTGRVLVPSLRKGMRMRRTILLLTVTIVMAAMVSAAVPAMADESQDTPVKNPGISTCDITSTGCEDTPDPVNEQGHNPAAEPDTNDPSPVEDPKMGISTHCRPGFELVNGEDPSGHGDQCVPKDEDASAPGAVQDGKVSEEKASTPGVVQDGNVSGEEASAPGTVQDGNVSEGIIPADKEKRPAPEEKNPPLKPNIAPGTDTHGCPFDYQYDDELDICMPPLDFMGVFVGEKPLPDSPGGYVSLLGDIGGAPLIAVGVALEVGLGHFVEDALVWSGEGGGPIGWGIQGLGYSIGFAGDMAGAILETAGEIVGGVADAVGGVVDGIGSAVEDIWDSIF
jgi:hypothetical protein